MPVVSHGETVASIIALVVAGLVAIALLAFIAIRPLLDYEECAALVAAGPADDLPEAEDAPVFAAVPVPAPAPKYVPRHSRPRGAR
jgi:hypothetical protein